MTRAKRERREQRKQSSPRRPGPGRPRKNPLNFTTFWVKLPPEVVRELEAYAAELTGNQSVQLVKYTRQDAARAALMLWAERRRGDRT